MEVKKTRYASHMHLKVERTLSMRWIRYVNTLASKVKGHLIFSNISNKQKRITNKTKNIKCSSLKLKYYTII